MSAFNPMSVMMGRPNNPLQPYVSRSPVDGPTNPLRPGQENPPTSGNLTPPHGVNYTNPLRPVNERPGGGPQQPSGPTKTLVPESVRATGTGPFDDAYRQNLATFAGGLFGRSGGNLSFNPTSNQPFGGSAVGAGNAPLFGMPSTQNQLAIGGNPFSFTPPTPAAPPQQSMQWWIDRFMQQGRGTRGNNTL